MGKYLIFLLLFVLKFNTINAQVTITGIVSDEQTKLPIQNASVTVGNIGGKTDSLGQFNFKVPIENLKQYAIKFTSIGYQEVIVNYNLTNIINVEMKMRTVDLQEVKVTAPSSPILERAIKLIPTNYPGYPHILTGSMKLQFVRNNSDYFKSNAIVQIYTPAYTSRSDEEVKVYENKIDTIKDKSLVFIRWIGGYLTVPHADFIHNREDFVDVDKINRFKYTYVGKKIYNGRKSYIIDFVSATVKSNQQHIRGILYIDTISYAFSGADVTYYNVSKYGTLPKSALNYRITYENIGGKWFVHDAHMIGKTIYKTQNPVTVTDYVTNKIDTVNVKAFKYSEIIQESDVTQTIDKKVATSILEKKDVLTSNDAQKDATNGLFNIDSVKFYNARSPKTGNWLNYLTKDNFHYSLSLIKFPVNINDNVTNISSIVNYGFQIGTYFRLYRGLFFQFEGAGNLGSSKINISQYAFHLAQDLTFNKENHPINISPLLGFHILSVNEKREGQKSTNTYFITGLSISYELTHSISLYASANSNDFKLSSNIVYLHSTNLSLNTGVIIRR